MRSDLSLVLRWLLGTCFPGWITLSNLYTGGGAWSYFNLMCPAVFKPMGGLPFSQWRQRRNGWLERGLNRSGGEELGGEEEERATGVSM